MNSLLLTISELQSLSGCKRAKAIASWLKQHSWVFELAKNGHPKVSRKFFDERMSGQSMMTQRSTPNVNFLFK